MARLLDCSPTYTDAKLVHVVRLEVPASVDMDALVAAVTALEAQPAPEPQAVPVAVEPTH